MYHVCVSACPLQTRIILVHSSWLQLSGLPAQCQHSEITWDSTDRTTFLATYINLFGHYHFGLDNLRLYHCSQLDGKLPDQLQMLRVQSHTSFCASLWRGLVQFQALHCCAYFGPAKGGSWRITNMHLAQYFMHGCACLCCLEQFSGRRWSQILVQLPHIHLCGHCVHRSLHTFGVSTRRLPRPTATHKPHFRSQGSAELSLASTEQTIYGQIGSVRP